MRAIAGSIVILAGSLLMGMTLISPKPIEGLPMAVSCGVILFGGVIVLVGLGDRPDRH